VRDFVTRTLERHHKNLEKWGEQGLGLLFIVLSEEVGEIARALLQNKGENVDLEREIIDASAVLLAMFERLMSLSEISRQKEIDKHGVMYKMQPKS